MSKVVDLVFLKSFWNRIKDTFIQTPKVEGKLGQVLTVSSDGLKWKSPEVTTQQPSDWNSTENPTQILNKPDLKAVATTGDYNDLINKPEIPDIIPLATKKELENYLPLIGGNLTGEVTSTSTIGAEKFIKNGGTKKQFLKADGSVDELNYATTDYVDQSEKKYNIVDRIETIATEQTNSLKNYIIKDTVFGLEFIFSDINDYNHNSISDSPKELYWNFSGNLEDLYIGFIKTSSMAVNGLFEITITSNTTIQVHKVAVMLDTPPDSTALFSTTLPFDIIVRRGSTAHDFEIYIKIPSQFQGTVKIKFVQYAYGNPSTAYQKIAGFDSQSSENYANLTENIEMQPLTASQLKSGEISDGPVGKNAISALYDCSELQVGSSVPDQVLNYIMLYNLNLKTNR